jgi:hypothetical protein
VLGRGEHARASRAYEIISWDCYAGRQAAAIEWAAALPESITTQRTILLQKFSELYTKDAAAAREMANRINNPAVTDAFNTVDEVERQKK